MEPKHCISRNSMQNRLGAYNGHDSAKTKWRRSSLGRSPEMSPQVVTLYMSGYTDRRID